MSVALVNVAVGGNCGQKYVSELRFRSGCSVSVALVNVAVGDNCGSKSSSATQRNLYVGM